MPIEKEHRYLIDKLPNTGTCINGYYITQSYLIHDEGRRYTERIRKRVNLDTGKTKLYRTTKIGKYPDVMENEYELDVDAYNELETYFVVGNVISKTRYVYVIDGLKWEIDVLNEIIGRKLIIAELENPPDEYNVPFDNYEDITESFEYSNANMALNW